MPTQGLIQKHLWQKMKAMFYLTYLNKVIIFRFHQFEQSAVIILNIAIIPLFHHTPSLFISSSKNGLNV